jgi:hypothetical protein
MSDTTYSKWNEFVNISSVKSRVEKVTTVTNEDTFKTTLEKIFNVS